MQCGLVRPFAALVRMSGLLAAVAALAVVLAMHVPAAASPNLQLAYSDQQLSLESDQAPLFEVLETLKHKTGIEVFVSEDISPDTISISVNRLPLRQAMKRILRNYSHALVYYKEEGHWKPARLEVYPQGKTGGNLKPLGPESESPATAEADKITVLVSSGQEVVTHNGIQRQGLLGPSRTEFQDPSQAAEVADEHWFALQQQAESREAEQYRELMRLKQQLDGVDDPDKKEALSTAYAQKMQDFYEQKKGHQSKVESLKRLQEFRELTGKQPAKGESAQ